MRIGAIFRWLHPKKLCSYHIYYGYNTYNGQYHNEFTVYNTTNKCIATLEDLQVIVQDIKEYNKEIKSLCIKNITPLPIKGVQNAE